MLIMTLKFSAQDFNNTLSMELSRKKICSSVIFKMTVA